MWLDGPVPKELSGFTGYLMARLGQASARRFHEALAPLGLHPRQFGVLNIVANEPGITQQALHDRTAIDPSSMVAVIDELEALGLAERRPHPSDRRARAIHLTAAGEEILGRGRGVAATLQRDFFAALSADERRTLHELLLKVLGGQGVGDAEGPRE